MNTNPKSDTEMYRDESNAALVDIIRDRIEAEGSITFQTFMELALYHPEHGYYQASRPRPGRTGDYLTAPEADPIFGQLVAEQIANFWTLLEQPAPFTVIEYGAGTGTLAVSVLEELRETQPELYAALRYRAIEISDERVASFHQTLTEAGHETAIDDTPSSASVTGCVIANEYLDALPVHRVTMRDGELQEVAVTWHQGWFAEQLIPLSDPSIARELARDNVELNEGESAEHNPGITRWMREIDQLLDRGYALVIDYGYPGDMLFAAHRRTGTVRSYYQHGVSTEYYRGVGLQDITAHVNLTAIARSAVALGWAHLGDTDQASFLGALGIAEHLMSLQQHPDMTIEQYLGIRAAVMRLIDPGSMGRFAVQFLGKRVPSASLPLGMTPLPPLG